MKFSPLIWQLLNSVKSTVKILSIFVAFFENMNFTFYPFLCRPSGRLLKMVGTSNFNTINSIKNYYKSTISSRKNCTIREATFLQKLVGTNFSQPSLYVPSVLLLPTPHPLEKGHLLYCMQGLHYEFKSMGARNYMAVITTMQWMQQEIKSDKNLWYTYSEKATKIWQNLQTCFDAKSNFKKFVHFFIVFLWPSQNT